MVVVDPPFITREVWEKYAETSNFLLKEKPAYNSESGMFLGTTVAENKEMIDELLEVSVLLLHVSCGSSILTSQPHTFAQIHFTQGKPCMFKPSIPNLVYQYNTYVNFDGCSILSEKNSEIPE